MPVVFLDGEHTYERTKFLSWMDRLKTFERKVQRLKADLTALVALGLSFAVFAAVCRSYAGSQELFEINNSVRALGMGNAFVSIVDDKDSLFYNPAGLGKVDSVRVTLVGLSAGANGIEGPKLVQDLQDSSKFAETVQSVYGKKYWAGGGARAAVVLPNYGFMVYNNVDAFARPMNPAASNIDHNLVSDFGFAAGFAYKLDWFTAGVVAKRVSRYGGRGEIGVATLASLSPDEIKKSVENRGSAFAMDLGFNASPPGPLKPTFSFVIRNAGLTQFSADSGVNRVPSDSPEWIAGMAFDLDAGFARLRPAVDVKWANRTSVPLGKRLHMGAELQLPLIAMRAGFNSGYYALGAGVDLGVLNFDAATYGVELGAYPGQQEDRRYMAQFTFEIDFGSWGGGTKGSSGGSSGGASGGSRSRLKPRR
jgi:hypothetical protein